MPRKSLRAEQRAVAGADAGGFAEAGVAILDRIGASRRQEIRRIKQAHQFWRGLQYLWWNERDQNWHLPFEQKLTDGSSMEDLPRYEFVTNIYQAFGLSLIVGAVAGCAARAIFPVVGAGGGGCGGGEGGDGSGGAGRAEQSHWEFDCRGSVQFWTDGKVGAYVRFVVDGQRFGFHPETEIGAREVKARR